MYRLLQKIIRTENGAERPNLNEVRLALTPLVRSRLPQAQELLKQIRTERRLLRYVYRREIREILDLLTTAEGLNL